MLRKYLFRIDPMQSAKSHLSKIKSSWKEVEVCRRKMEEEYITLGIIEPDLPKWLTTGEKVPELYPNSVDWETAFRLLTLWEQHPEKLKETPLQEVEETLQFALTVSATRDDILREYKLFLLPIYSCGM